MSGQLERPPTHPEVIVGDAQVSAVKVWQPWIRTLHWTLAGSVVILSVTGYLIGNPTIAGADDSDLMANVRFIHLLFAWIFIAVLIGRFILAFTGNPWARWEQIVPVWKTRRSQLWHTMRYYAFLEKHPAEVVGHNPMAGLAYLGFFGLLGVQVITGLSLVAVVDRNGWQWLATGWIFHWLTVPGVRFVHHLAMWLVWTFVVSHIYAASLSDRIERSGEISSMVGGWKLLPRARVDEELANDAAKRRKHFKN